MIKNDMTKEGMTARIMRLETIIASLLHSMHNAFEPPYGDVHHSHDNFDTAINGLYDEFAYFDDETYETKLKPTNNTRKV